MDGRLKVALADPIDDPQTFIESEWFAAQQKLDGHRMLVSIDDGDIRPLNRQGEIRKCPSSLIEALRAIPGAWLFDGELMDDGTYWIFDIQEAILGAAVGELWQSPWLTRQRFLAKVFDKYEFPERIRLLPYSSSVEEKRRLFEVCQESRAEGIVFKHVQKRYLPGKTRTWLKYKFLNQLDAVVIGLRFEGRDNLILGLYDDIHPEPIEIGKVSARTGDGRRVEEGDVITVTCLNVSDDGKLIQPTKPRIRTDKNPWECGIDQLAECTKVKTYINLKEGN